MDIHNVYGLQNKKTGYGCFPYLDGGHADFGRWPTLEYTSLFANVWLCGLFPLRDLIQPPSSMYLLKVWLLLYPPLTVVTGLEGGNNVGVTIRQQYFRCSV